MHRSLRTGFLLVAAAVVIGPTPANAGAPASRRPVATYSIVALDTKTGELGAAVQSHWFSVGAVVPWVEPGVGAVATQSFVETAYGPRGLVLMAGGVEPSAALAKLLEQDPHPEVRQVAFVDAAGRVAAHTGQGCIPAAGHRIGDGYSVQANLMLTDEVPAAMARAFEASSGPLAERMLAALQAAQATGGDIRGKQSAAIVVAKATKSSEPWDDRLVDLRVEDSDHPLEELARLLKLHRAYERMNLGDEAMARGALDEALRKYSEAEAMFPDNDEFVFWHAVTLVGTERVAEALPLFGRAFRMNPAWMLVVPRLIEVGQLPSEPGLEDRILATGPRRTYRTD